MPASSRAYQARITTALLLLLAVIGGCSREKYRRQADREAYDVIAERNVDPRWQTTDYGIDMDPRSRYFDPFNPDHAPMPPDDPASHQYMRVVAGRKGWKHWGDNGFRHSLENPEWKKALPAYVAVGAEGAVQLNLDSALKLAYLHSPSHQRQLETLYLSALDVTTERFRLDTQFFGGYDARYEHNGSLIPPGLTYVPALGRFVVSPAFDGDGVENNRVTLGRPFAGDPALQARRRFATAGDLLVGFANSFVFEFTGSDANLAASLANFSLVQPLLRGAGKDIALEQLTFSERALLANVRAYSQFRQGFYTQVSIGEVGVSGPQRAGAGPFVNVFSGQGVTGGYVGLLQQLQELRNTEDNLNLQLQTLSQLEALLDVGIIDLLQVDEIRQNVEGERANLLLRRNSLQLALDRYKTGTLGLPPDLPVELDDSLIRQFQFVSREATAVQDEIVTLRDHAGALPDKPATEAIQQVLTEASVMVDRTQGQLEAVQADLARMDQMVPTRERSMTTEERQQFRIDREQLWEALTELRAQQLEDIARLEQLQRNLSDENAQSTVRTTIVWCGSLLRTIQRSIVIQARARLEAVTVTTTELPSETAFRIALDNRLDFMNARAALVDSWRQIQVNADALQSVLDITASGDLRTARNNPASFRAPTGNFRLGLEFDAPITRLVERNRYRESLIRYQQDRRLFIQSRDALHLELRELLRQIQQLRQNLEIQRRAVAIAIRRVDLTRAQLYAPVPPPAPGQRAAAFGPAAARQLREAQSALRTTQDAFLRVWLSHYAARMRLARELGIMQLDPSGRWVENPIPGTPNGSPSNLEELAPGLPILRRLPQTSPIGTEAVESDGLLPPQA
jgi:hypothetical protein